MDEKILRKVQLYQLSILKEVDRICRKHEIRYYMIGGTLLGAVRHKGFIPWDDDLDIAMPREDYDRFTKVCMTELPSNLFLQNTENDGYWMFITKLRLNNSTFDDDISINSKSHNGIYIDIFPLDKVPENDTIGLKFRYQLMRFMSAIAEYKNGKRDYKSKVVKLFSAIFSFLSYKQISKIARKCVTHYEYSNSEYVTSFMSNYGYVKQRMLFNEVYGEGTNLEFEGQMFYAPKDWHSNLVQLFGNYMELPPIEKRGVRHIRLNVVLPTGESWSQ